MSFDFPSKGLYLLSGPNGSGKSSLLKIISGADARHDGRLLFDGQEITSKNADDYSYRYVAYLPQDYVVFDEMTVIENVLFPYGSNDEPKARQVLDEMGLGQLIEEKGENLSSGEKARLSFARALFKDPAILLADEIGVNLDPENEKIVLSLLEKISRKSLVVFVTHENEDTNSLHPQGSLKMDSGRLVEADVSSSIESSSLSKRPSHDFSLWSNTWGSFRKNIVFYLLVFFSTLLLGGGTAFFASAYPTDGYDSSVESRVAQHYVSTSPGILLESGKETLFPSSDLFVTDEYSVGYSGVSNDFLSSANSEVGNRISGVFYFLNEADFISHGITLAKDKDGAAMGNYPTANDQILISSYSYPYVLSYAAKAKGVDTTAMAKTLFDEYIVFPFASKPSLRVSGVYQASEFGYANYETAKQDIKTTDYDCQPSAAFYIESAFALESSLLKERAGGTAKYFIHNFDGSAYSSSIASETLIRTIAQKTTWGEHGSLSFFFTDINWFEYFLSNSLGGLSWVFFALGLGSSLIFPLAFSLANRRKMAMARLVGASRRSQLAGNITAMAISSLSGCLLGLLVGWGSLTLFSNVIDGQILGGCSGFLSLSPLFSWLSVIPSMSILSLFTVLLCWLICPRDLGRILEKWRSK
ncbi:MAG: ATP-binding cassette domain-containing protein [Bacilli bacterium]|nr:ATP-binding cassette domain-containing protein [Bacilli bacterium]